MSMNAMIDLLARADIGYLPLFLVCVFLHFLAEPMRWACYSGGSLRTAFRLYFQIFSICAFLSLTLPMKLGVPARVALLRLKAGLDFSNIFTLLTVDTLVYYGGWALSATVAIAAFSYQGRWEWMGLPLVVLLCLAMVATIWKRRAKGGRLKNKGVSNITPTSKWAQCWTILREIGARLTGRTLLAVLIIVIIDVATQVARHGALLAMFNSSLSWPQLCGIVAISIFAGLASLMPLGLGGYDITLVYLLTQAGVPAEMGTSIVIINRLGSFAMSAVLGGWAGWRLGISPLRAEWLRKEKK